MGRRFRRRPPLGFFFVLLLASLFMARWFQTRSEPPPVLSEGEAIIISVVDGRTIIVGGVPSSAQSSVAVRLTGLRASNHAATPEWLGQLVGQTVQIGLDKRRRDVDGTFLAYVYYEDRLLNAELLRLGLAEYEPYPGDSPGIARTLREAADVARTTRRLGPVPNVGK